MKYETPELTALTPALNAIQSGDKLTVTHILDSPLTGEVNEATGAYADWE